MFGVSSLTQSAGLNTVTYMPMLQYYNGVKVTRFKLLLGNTGTGPFHTLRDILDNVEPPSDARDLQLTQRASQFSWAALEP